MSKRSSDEFSGGPPGKLEEKSEEEKLSLDPAKKPKLAFSIGKKPLNQAKTNTIVTSRLPFRQKVKEPVKKDSLKAAFNSESEEEEEMPPEAKMRMRNIGRDTPTSAGPNSFGKTKQGFCDAKKVFEKKLKDAAEKTRDGEN